MNQYAATIETDDDDELNRETVEYDALSASEAQAYAMDDLQDNQRIVAIWQRIY
jgi:N6-adenosine-specific RNA methylase IME4